jgi:hypothetical protein
MQVSRPLLANMLLIAICLLPGGSVLAEPGKAVFVPDAYSGPRTGSWGDQGDGTYRNPILNADYPDVDVEQVGDTYYMISSKQHMAPGMVILESKDMVNWQTIGHVWNKLSWDPRYNWDRMDGYSYGVWAGDLAYHDGRWYCYQIDNVVGLYMSSAPASARASCVSAASITFLGFTSSRTAPNACSMTAIPNRRRWGPS